jgi:tetratricopeptide (TPR) repeat protein
MTLILNCLTHDYLFQVSDRRLVYTDKNGDVKDIRDDNANKAIFYCGHITFGYTGLADIEGKRSDYWLLEKLPTSFETFHSKIKEDATEAFKKLPPKFKPWKRHAFVGIGWIRVQKAGPLHPALVLISNFHSENGKQLSSVNESFSVFSMRLPDQESLFIYPVGQPIDKEILNRLHRNIRKRLKKRADYKEIMKVLIGEVRGIAEKSKGKIGKNLMAVGMPKAAAGSGLVSPIRGIADYVESMNIFLYFPNDRSDGMIYSPHVKCGRITQADLTYDHRDGNFVSEFSFKISSTASDHFNTGIALCKKNKYKEAMLEFNRAIELKSDLAEAWTGKGIALDKLRRSKEALEVFDKAIEYKPDLAWAWTSKGVTLGNLGRTEEAVEAFNKASELRPDDVDILYQKGFAFGKTNRLEEALEIFNKIIELKPDHLKAWTSKGVVFELLGRTEEAIEAFNRVTKLRPDDAYAWYYLACLYARKRIKTNVFKALTKAINFDIKYKERARKDQDFKSLLNDEGFKKLIE